MESFRFKGVFAMDEVKLKYFASVARHLSFTKAAEDLHVVQSTISKQISALEKDLGVKLFHRDHQSVSLTPAGARLASDVDEYLEQYRTIDERVRRLYIETDQRLRIGMGPLEFPVIAQPLRLFTARWPTVEISCAVYTYQRLVRHLRTGTVDIAVGPITCASDVSGAVYTPARRENWVVTAARDASLWTLPRESQSVLEGQTVITLFENIFEPVRPHCIKNDFRQAAFSHCTSLSPLITMVRARCGVSLLPASLRESIPPDVIMKPGLLRVPLEQDVVVSYRPNLSNTAVEHFLDCCREVFNQPMSSHQQE